ncbi:MAG: hypothetical protein AseanaTS_19100 [Candidatus Pelagadaptatus aseana]|uniref:hypothetical protein n=1 Tax=Candidatus Pelagadaptatus aseana TaxID=3120508 RepID=UPI0039B1C804
MTKRLISLSLFTLVCLLAYFLLKPDPNQQVMRFSLPWEITVNDDGTSEVFGLTLEQTNLAQAIAHLGMDYKLAIIANQDNYAALEAYYSHFSSGPIRGKLILVVDAPQQALADIQDNPAASKYMASGARQFLLNPDDKQRAEQWPIKSLSFIPAVNLEQDLIEQRFGKPQSIIAETETTRHLLYPKLGLDAVISDEAKEQLLYVAPRSFSSLEQPLQTLDSDNKSGNEISNGGL